MSSTTEKPTRKLEPFQQASLTAEFLAAIPQWLRVFAEENQPEPIAALLATQLPRLDIEQAEQAIAENANALTAVCFDDGPIVLGGEKFPNAHDAALGFSKAALTTAHVAVDVSSVPQRMEMPNMALPAEQIHTRWDALRKKLLTIPDYDHSGLATRIQRERAALLSNRTEIDDGAGVPDGVALDETAVAILYDLRGPVELKSPAEISGAPGVRIGRKAVGERLKKLTDAGYARKSGDMYNLTDAGRKKIRCE